MKLNGGLVSPRNPSGHYPGRDRIHNRPQTVRAIGQQPGVIGAGKIPENFLVAGFALFRADILCPGTLGNITTPRFHGAAGDHGPDQDRVPRQSRQPTSTKRNAAVSNSRKLRVVIEFLNVGHIGWALRVNLGGHSRGRIFVKLGRNPALRGVQQLQGVRAVVQALAASCNTK